MVISELGLKVGTNLLNMTGIANSVDELGPSVLTEAAALSANPAAFVAAVKEMWAEAPPMATRAATFQREAADARQRLKQFVRLHVEKAGIDVAIPIPEAMTSVPMVPMALGQLWVDTPTYRIAKQQAIARGADEQTAIKTAVQVVKDTQGSGLPADLPQIMRAHKNWTLFMGFTNRTLNRVLRKRTMNPGPKGLGKMGMAILVMSALPAALMMRYRFGVRGDEPDDDTPWWLTLLGDTGSSLAGGHVVTSFAAQAVRYGTGGPAELEVYDKFGRMAREWFDGELDEKDFETAFALSGILLHLPTAQTLESWRGYQAAMDGDAPPSAVIVGPPRGVR